MDSAAYALSLGRDGGTGRGHRTRALASVIVALPLMGVLVLMTLSCMRWLAQDHPSSGAAGKITA